MVKGKLMMNKKIIIKQNIYYRPASTKKKHSLPVRSFSLCSILPGYKRNGTWKATTPADRTKTNAEREIDKFEHDFALSMWKITLLFQKDFMDH